MKALVMMAMLAAFIHGNDEGAGGTVGQVINLIGSGPPIRALFGGNGGIVSLVGDRGKSPAAKFGW